MKTISPVKFTLATFIFTWLLQGTAILSGQSSKDFPSILFYIIGGCGPSLVAIFFVWRNFNIEQRREFWSRVFSPRRIQPIWWIVTLVAVPSAMLLGVWVNALLGGTLPQMDYVNLLMSQPEIFSHHDDDRRTAGRGTGLARTPARCLPEEVVGRCLDLSAVPALVALAPAPVLPTWHHPI
jgi:hypothetical protein